MMFCTESIRAKLGLPPPPQMDVGPYAYANIMPNIYTY